MRSFRLTTSEQLLNYNMSKKAKSHRGWRNISGLEAHPGQGLGELHRVDPAVRGHVCLTSDVDIHLTDWRGAGKRRESRFSKEPSQHMLQKRTLITRKIRPGGMIQAEQCHPLVKRNLRSKQTLTLLSRWFTRRQQA